MKTLLQRERENQLFALKNIREVATRRKHLRCLKTISILEGLLENQKIDWTSSSNGVAEGILNDVRKVGLFLCSDLRIPMKFEMKEIITPILEVKTQVHEFSRQWWGDYLQWLPDGPLRPEEVLKMLEDDLYKLDIAEELFTSREKDD
jgi:hypothetical protein